MSTSMRTVLIHPTGNANVRQALLALQEEDILADFYTTLAWSDQKRTRLPTALRKRSYDLPARNLHTFPAREFTRLLVQRAPLLGSRFAFRQGPLGIDRVAESLDARLAADLTRGIIPCTHIFGYEDFCAASFCKAKDLGLSTVLEMPYVYWRESRRRMHGEAAANPAWASTLTGSRDSREKLERKDSELSSADLILVPSAQVADSIRAYFPDANLAWAPYGAPPPCTATPRKWRKGPLRLLYVGRMQADKGLAYLDQALNHFDPEGVRLTLVGALPPRRSRGLTTLLSKANVQYLGTMSRPAVMEQMLGHHHFVMPSLYEGRSLACLEAVSAGLPLLVTASSGVADLVEDGLAGALIQEGSVESIVNAVHDLVHNPTLVENRSLAALSVAGRSSWEKYRTMLRAALVGTVA